MARLPYADINAAETREIAERVAQQRGKVLHLYGMLLHSPNVADGWLHFLTAIRQKSSLPGDLREIVIMRIAALNGAKYEADQHRPYALKEGVTPEQLDALDKWSTSELLLDRHKQVLALTDAMTKDIVVSDHVFGALKANFDSRAIVELAATIAAYNMVSRFLVAMNIASDDQFGPN